VAAHPAKQSTEPMKSIARAGKEQRMQITQYGEQRTRTEGFGELCAQLIVDNGLDATKYYVGAMLAGDSVGTLNGGYETFLEFMRMHDGYILSCLLRIESCGN
jgi:tryptophanase